MSILDCSPAFGQSWSLRYPVPTGTRLTGGVLRRSGDILVVLHGSESTGILMFSGLRRQRTNRSNRSARLRETRTQCECASSHGFASRKRLARRWTITDRGFFLFLPHGHNFRVWHHWYFLLACEGCGRHCATLIEKVQAAFQSHNRRALWHHEVSSSDTYQMAVNCRGCRRHATSACSWRRWRARAWCARPLLGHWRSQPIASRLLHQQL